MRWSELAHEFDAEFEGGSGASAGRDELVGDDGVLVNDRPAGGDGLDERGVGGGVAAVEDAQLGQDRGRRADRRDGQSFVRATQHLGLDRGRGLQAQGPGHAAGQEEDGVGG